MILIIRTNDDVLVTNNSKYALFQLISFFMMFLESFELIYHKNNI